MPPPAIVGPTLAVAGWVNYPGEYYVIVFLEMHFNDIKQGLASPGAY